MVSDKQNSGAGEAVPASLLRASGPGWLTMLLGAVILLSGIVIGVGGAMVWLGRRSSAGSNGADQTANLITERIARSCQLDDKQTEKVRKIIARRLEAIQDIRQEMAEEVLAEHETLRGEMKQILTPEQFERWSGQMDAIRARSPVPSRGRWNEPGPRQPPPGQEPTRPPREPRLGQEPPRPPRPPAPGQEPPRPLRDLPRNPARLLRLFDANGDDKLTADEAPPRIWPQLLKADRDGDGAVSRQELERAFQPATGEGPVGPAYPG